MFVVLNISCYIKHSSKLNAFFKFDYIICVYDPPNLNLLDVYYKLPLSHLIFSSYLWLLQK